MLIYNSAFDIYHSIFRMLQLINNIKTEYVEVDRIRIWDFYLAFPNEIEKIKFPREFSEIKKVFKDTENPYDEIIDSKKIFDKMKTEIPLQLKQKIENPSERINNIIKLFTGPFSNISLLGDKGLKYRTGLIEFKYDYK